MQGFVKSISLFSAKSSQKFYLTISYIKFIRAARLLPSHRFYLTISYIRFIKAARLLPSHRFYLTISYIRFHKGCAHATFTQILFDYKLHKIYKRECVIIQIIENQR